MKKVTKSGQRFFVDILEVSNSYPYQEPCHHGYSSSWFSSDPPGNLH